MVSIYYSETKGAASICSAVVVCMIRLGRLTAWYSYGTCSRCVGLELHALACCLCILVVHNQLDRIVRP
jgi:hypothetical protein